MSPGRRRWRNPVQLMNVRGIYRFVSTVKRGQRIRPELQIGGLPVKSAMNHELLNKEAYTADRLDKFISSWSWQQLILRLSFFEHLRVFLRGQGDLDSFLVSNFLHPDLRDAALRAMAAHNSLLINQPALAFLVFRVLKIGANAPDRRDDRFEFGELLLSANDLLYAGAGGDTSEELFRQVDSLIITNSLYGDSDPPQHALPRYFYLLATLASDMQHQPGARDMLQDVEALTGLTLSQLYGLCLGIFGHYASLAQQTKAAWAKGEDTTVVPGDFIISRDTYLRNTSLSDDLGKAILSSWSTNPTSVRAVQQKSPFDLECLRQRPLVDLGGERLAVPFPGFLFDRATIMLWWDIHNHLPKQRRGQFATWWGQITQRYVYDLLEQALGSSTSPLRRWFREDDYERDQAVPPSPDAIVVGSIRGGLALAFIEVKSSRPKYEDVVLGDTEALRKHWESRLIGEQRKKKAVRQIDIAITKFRNSKLRLPGINPADIRRILPVVVTLDHWPIRGKLYYDFAKDVADANLLRQETVAPFEIFSCHDFEILVARMGKGEQLLEILDQRSIDNSQATPVRDTGAYSQVPPLLEKVWERIQTESEIQLGFKEA